MFTTRRRRVISAVATATSAAALVLGGAVAAEAASSHNISGTVYEDGSWFRSSTTRSVDSNTDIVLTTTSVPTRGVEFRLWNAKNNTVFTGITTYTSNTTKTLVSNVLSGTLFQNDFRKHDRTCTVRCGDPHYDFSGNEIY